VIVAIAAAVLQAAEDNDQDNDDAVFEVDTSDDTSDEDDGDVAAGKPVNKFSSFALLTSSTSMW
jgi:hypothetical protein